MAQREVVWEAHDHFQKQTYRNRCCICTDRGKHQLILPTKHSGQKKEHRRYSEVQIDEPLRWKRQHWRTLETAYRTSPFFEFYEDDLKPLFEDDEACLYRFNLKILETLCYCLGLLMPQRQTERFDKQPSQYFDARFLVAAKREPHLSTEYYAQVFGERHGFVANLSIIDLLCNEGPNALAYLKRQKLVLKCSKGFA